jgi:homoprotocatechuate degradation regulator HpaR
MTSKRVDAGADRGLPMRAFSNSLPMDLLRAREAVMRLFRPGLRRDGVTEQQWRILRALAYAGPMEVSQLAAATFLLAPSLSRILPELEARRLIGRAQADADLRRNVVRIERKGLRLMATHAPYAEQVYANIEAAFGPERLRQLGRLLRKLQEVLENEQPDTGAQGSRPRAATMKRARSRGERA